VAVCYFLNQNFNSMAKKKAKSKKASTTTRRRKVGAMALNAKSPLLTYGAMAGGFLMADTINAQVDKVTGTMDDKIKGGITGGIGAALVYMKLGAKKSPLEVVAGGVLVGAGVKRLLKAFGILNGFQSVPVLGRRQVNGYGKVPVLGGYQTNPVALNGVFNGYQVPRTPGSQVVGSAGGYSNGGSNCMQ
jgi:hypothetical protein